MSQLRHDSSHKDSQFKNRLHPIRVNESGHIHFVTTSCIGHKPFFSKSWTRKIIMDSIDEIRCRTGFLIIGYVLMPEHSHFLIVPGSDQSISQTMGCLKWYTAISLLKVLREKGMDENALWKTRFYDFNVFTHNKLKEKLNYCHMNPVRRELVESPEEWEYSSYINYEMNDDSVFRVDRWWDYWKV